MLRATLSEMPALGITFVLVVVFAEASTAVKNEMTSGFYRQDLARGAYFSMFERIWDSISEIRITALSNAPGTATAGLFVGVIVGGLCRKLMRSRSLKRWAVYGMSVGGSLYSLLGLAIGWDGTFGSVLLAVIRGLLVGMAMGASIGVCMAVFLRLLDRALPSTALRAAYGAVVGTVVGVGLAFDTALPWPTIGATIGALIGAILLALYRPLAVDGASRP